MSDLTDYADALPPVQGRRLREIYRWIAANYPQLQGSIRWKQPMFTDHGTLIVAFSPASTHLAIALETEAMNRFEHLIAERGYSTGKRFVRLPWDAPFDYDFLTQVINFNLVDKADVRSFWRHEVD